MSFGKRRATSRGSAAGEGHQARAAYFCDRHGSGWPWPAGRGAGLWDGLQTLRDWVHRYNEAGIGRLADRARSRRLRSCNCYRNHCAPRIHDRARGSQPAAEGNSPSEVKPFGRWYHVKVSGKTFNRCCGGYETTGSVEPRSSAELCSRHLCWLRHGVPTGADVRHVEPFGPANKFCCPGPSFLFSGNDTLFY